MRQAQCCAGSIAAEGMSCSYSGLPAKRSQTHPAAVLQVVLLGTMLIHIAQGLDAAFAGHPTLLLFFVMICCPLCMNMIQVGLAI